MLWRQGNVSILVAKASVHLDYQSRSWDDKFGLIVEDTVMSLCAVYIVCMCNMYIHVCVASKYLVCLSLDSTDGNVVFDTMNLNTQANWYTDQPAVECKEVPVLCLQQLEKDTIFLGLERILI